MLARTPCGIPPELVDYAKEIERIANSVSHEPICAEITEGATAQWLLLRAKQNEAGKLTRNLARRRFGVFHPIGAFPAGYVFAYAFDAGKMIERIKATPGFGEVVCALSDAFVQKIRADYYYSQPTPRTHTTVTGERHIAKAKKPKAKRLTKAEKKALFKLRKVLKKLGFKDSSTLESARALEVHDRIALLRNTVKALTSAA